MRTTRKPRETKAAGLSAREREVMHWVCWGKTDAEIGQILSISEETVGNHLAHCRRKLDANCKALLVARFLVPEHFRTQKEG